MKQIPLFKPDRRVKLMVHLIFNRWNCDE